MEIERESVIFGGAGREMPILLIISAFTEEELSAGVWLSVSMRSESVVLGFWEIRGSFGLEAEMMSNNNFRALFFGRGFRKYCELMIELR